MRESRRSSRKLHSSKGNLAHFFDLDRTLVRKNASFAFYFHLLREKIISKTTLFGVFSLFVQYRCGLVSLKALQKRAFQLILQGRSLAVLESAADRFVAPFAKKWVHRQVYEYLQNAKQKKEPVYLLSASSDFLVQKFALHFGFDKAVGSQYSIDRDGALCDILSQMTGSEKLKRAKEWAEGLNAAAYTDSSDDVPLLEWAVCPIAVNPDRILRRRAEKMRWAILP